MAQINSLLFIHLPGRWQSVSGSFTKNNALIIAGKRLQSMQHSMALEAQSIDKSDEEEQLRCLSEQLVKQAGSNLWEDDA